MDAPRQPRFLIVESDAQYAQWLQHAVGAGWPEHSVVIMDWASFGRVRTAMTVRDYDIVMLALRFDEGIEDPAAEGFDWIKKLRSQPGFPEMIILAEGGSELVAVRTLRLGAADYLPKRLLTPSRLQRSIKLTLRAIEKELARRAERAQAAAAKPGVSSDERNKAPPAHIATHTGASLARAAQMATQSPSVEVTAAVSANASAEASRPAAGEPSSLATAPPVPTPIATHTGASLAKAAQLALAMHPTRTESGEREDSARLVVVPPPATAAAPVAPPVDDTPAAVAPASHAASSPPGDSSPAAPRDSKGVAPESHQIPGYTILQRIGESEAAAVYLAISEDVGRNVALKVSKRRYTGSSDDTGQRAIMFQREFEAIAALDHPSIIDLFDYGIHEGVEYLAMEYFPCGDLKARLQNPLTAEEAITFVKEIARSLKVVHDAGIIHRDLKPPNVMLRDDGSVVLIDFGLARSLLGGDSSTRTGVLRGSPYYMSPEQAQGENLDARTDLYSLGVMLYEMLAGRKPYLGASAIDVLQQHVMAPVPELPLQYLIYQPLLERLMAKSREQRFASCDALLSALDQMSQSLNEGIIDPATLVSMGAGG